ncbi:MAG: hypothetical protein N2712_00365 [Brevinematales bacterium]|nr:hypothetical protein [Brevinematales bacterium]
MVTIIAIIVLITTVVFLLLKKEFLYAIIIGLMFLVSIPFVMNINILTPKEPNVVLMVDYSESSKDKVKPIETKLTKLEFDFIRKFGIPYNKEDDFANLNEKDFYLILSDFLFEIPNEIKSKSNIMFIHIGNSLQTNHLIKEIYTTNIGQVEYLTIDMIAISEIRILDKTKRSSLYKEYKKQHLIQTSSLPEEFIISSLNTNIAYKLPNIASVGIFWFELNRDLKNIVGVLKTLGYKYELFANIRKENPLRITNKFKNLIIGYPKGKNINIEEIIKQTDENSRILVISPDEEFIKNIISFSKIRNMKLSSEDFTYNQKLGIIDIDFDYPVLIDNAFKYSFPKIPSEVIPLDNSGIVIYFNYLEREFILVLIEDVSKVDIENIKVGIYSTFFFDLFSELCKFLLKENHSNDKIVLQESAFSGSTKPTENSIYYEEVSKQFINKIKKNYSTTVLDTLKIDISSFWFIMVGVILILGLKWIFRR